MEKLVRDKIPEIIKNDTGRQPIFRIADPDEIALLLRQKLKEEFTELGNAIESGSIDEIIDEMADVSEVIVAMGIQAKSTSQITEARRLEKRADRGGFEKGIVMNFPKS